MRGTLRRGAGALVSEQLARRLKLALGSSLDIPTTQGDWRVKIDGIFPDYGNPKGQLRINLDALMRHWPDTPRVSFGLRVAPQAAAGLIEAMKAQFGQKIGRIIDQDGIKRLSMRIFEHTFAVTAALNTLMLVVSAIALLASLSTLGEMRLAQVAPVWACGVPRQKLAELEFLRVLALSAATALLAIPLGLALTWCLVAVVNVQAFGWRLPFQLFPWQWAEISGAGAGDGGARGALADPAVCAHDAGATSRGFLPMSGRFASILSALLAFGAPCALAQGFAGLGGDASGFA